MKLFRCSDVTDVADVADVINVDDMGTVFCNWANAPWAYSKSLAYAAHASLLRTISTNGMTYLSVAVAGCFYCFDVVDAAEWSAQQSQYASSYQVHAYII